MTHAEFDQALKTEGAYRTPDSRWQALRRLPGTVTARFYADFFWQAIKGARRMSSGMPAAEAIRRSSFGMLRACERVGGALDIAGLQHVQRQTGPVIFIGNHMSSYETTLLPVILFPFRDTTFIIKESLLDLPCFGALLQGLKAITVTRESPRKDLQSVFSQGAEFTAAGRSIVVFPQSTRSVILQPDKFSSIGVKLARRTETPIIPFAIKTDMWSNGAILKDYGQIHPERTVHVEFAPAFTVTDDKAAQQQVLDFVADRLTAWGGQVAEQDAETAPATPPTTEEAPQ